MSWAAILSAFLKGFAALVDWLRDRQLIEAGKATQRATDLQAAARQEEKADEVDRRVDAAGPAELDQLRAKWTRP